MNRAFNKIIQSESVMDQLQIGGKQSSSWDQENLPKCTSRWIMQNLLL